MRRIRVKPNRFAIVDDADYETLKRYKWRLTGKGYAGAHAPGGGGTIYMHHLVAGPGRRDHRDGKKLNNRRANLRPASGTQNNANCKRYKSNLCGFKGVARAGKGWRARITINRVETHLGMFATPRLAHRAYIAAARKCFGEFARAA